VQFQIDGNLGYVAAVGEMLLHSHIPGVLSLLPALPKTLPRGHVYGLQVRGAVEVSMGWSNGVLVAVELVFHSKHFWQKARVPYELYAGVSRAHKDSDFDIHMFIAAPNRLRGVGHHSYNTRVGINQFAVVSDHIPEDMETKQVVTELSVRTTDFPCVVTLCISDGDVQCKGMLEDMRVYREQKDRFV